MNKYLNIVISLLVGALGLIGFYWLAAVFGWATYDMGILQKLFLSAVEMPVIHGFSMLFFALTFPRLYKYIDRDFKENNSWSTLSHRDRTIAGLVLLCWYLLCYTLLVALQ